MIRGVAVRSSGAASAKTAALSRRSSRPTPERAAGTRTATGARVCRFRFFPKTKGLAQPEVQGKPPRSGQKIDGHDLFARLRIRIKTSVGGLFDGWRIRRARCKRGPLIEQRVAEWVQRGGDIEWAPGGGDQEWAQPECVGQTRGPEDEYAMANIKRGA